MASGPTGAARLAYAYDRSLFERFPVTTGLIAANVALFLAGHALQRGLSEPAARFGVLPLDGRLLFMMGANHAHAVLHGEPWRLLTACFLHADLLHVGLNMWALFTLGIATEYAYGPARALVAYVLTGIAGSAASVAWALYRNGPGSVGASGAICGLLGLLLASSWRPRAAVQSAEFRILKSWFLQILLISLIPGIDKAGHLGGAAAGMLLGLVLDRSRVSGRTPPAWRAAAAAAVLSIVAAGALQARAFPEHRRTLSAGSDWLEVRLTIFEETLAQLEGHPGDWSYREVMDHLAHPEDDPETSALFAEARALLQSSDDPGRPEKVRAFREKVEAWANRAAEEFHGSPARRR